jgi:hypothetical protein
MILAQQRGEVCAMVDPEHSFDNERFEYLGGDPMKFASASEDRRGSRRVDDAAGFSCRDGRIWGSSASTLFPLL